MQRNQAISVISCLMVLGAVTADHAVDKLAVPQTHRLPVESFPLRIGPWHGGPLQPVDPAVQDAIPTATIQDRTYSNLEGQQMDLTLVTAEESEHLHDPSVCFPAQGYALSEVRHPQIDGETATLMTATSGLEKLTVMYWTTGYFPPAPPRIPWVRKIAALRKRLVGKHEGVSLLVRLICPDTDEDNAALMRFAGNLSAPLHAITKAGAAEAPADAHHDLLSDRVQ